MHTATLTLHLQLRGPFGRADNLGNVVSPRLREGVYPNCNSDCQPHPKWDVLQYLIGICNPHVYSGAQPETGTLLESNKSGA